MREELLDWSLKSDDVPSRECSCQARFQNFLGVALRARFGPLFRGPKSKIALRKHEANALGLFFQRNPPANG